MAEFEQGDILKVNGISFPVIVVSNDLFNSSGKAVVCPIVNNNSAGPLHIELSDAPVSGYVLCEQVRYLDLSSRRFSRLSNNRYFDIMNISDAVMGIFDYQSF